MYENDLMNFKALNEEYDYSAQYFIQIIIKTIKIPIQITKFKYYNSYEKFINF